MDPPPAHGGLASAVLLAARPPAARLDRGPAGALYGLAVGVALKLAWTAPAVVEVVEAVVETAAEDSFAPLPPAPAPAAAPSQTPFHIPPVVPILAAAAVHALIWLARHWSVRVDRAVAYSKAASIAAATHVAATTTGVHGTTEIVPLTPASTEEGADSVAFETGRARFVWDAGAASFRPLRYPDAAPFAAYRRAAGLAPAAAAAALAAFGPNATPVPVPAFADLLKQQLVAPFFVFQVFCVGLWCLDEYWAYSLFTLLMLVGFESTVVGQRLRNLNDLRGLQAPKPVVAVYRGGRWTRTPGEGLVPGDLISVGASVARGGHAPASSAAASPADVPADCLLLAGSAVVEEAVLTGESAPQWKAPLYESAAAAAATAAADGAPADAAPPADDVLNVDPAVRLDAGVHRAHVLFGGTTMLQAAADPGAHVRTPDGGVLALVLRTGFESAQGRLMRTILASSSRVTAASWEAGAFILLLLVFAVAAAWHVLTVGLADPSRDRFKLYLNCVMIVTSVVPPELPMELTIAVNASLLALARRAIFCTEPFRIPLAGAVTTACFDKTGTLTSDEMVLEGVAAAAEEEGGGGLAVRGDALVPPRDAPPAARLVLAACHSLAPAGGGALAGDPLEKAAFAAVGWSLGEGGRVTSRGGTTRTTATVLRRHHFSAALRRMSAVLSVDSGSGSSPRLVVAAKGAPEALRPLLAAVPAGYDAAAAAYAARGGRVLALATRDLPAGTTPAAARGTARADAEAGLAFAGFAVLGCPLRPESAPAIAELTAAGHDAVMITGDAPLTACHVARVLKMTTRPTLVLARAAGAPAAADAASRAGDEPDAFFEWTPAEGGGGDAPRRRRPWVPPGGGAGDPASLVADGFALCVTGDGLAHAVAGDADAALVPLVSVWARTSPDQKEAVLARLRGAGAVTLMCGDGTNDVGALKAAHVGVALLPPRPGGGAAAGGGGGARPPAAGRITAAGRGAGGRGAGRGGGAAAPAPLPTLAGAKMLADLRAAGRPVDARMERMAALLDRLEASAAADGGGGPGDGPPIVRPGDASAAAPFTAKAGGAAACADVIRQGRAALVTTVQMFKILGLLSLSSAYALSVMYLAGVKLSDGQATAQGALSAALFFMISQAAPLPTLAPDRPHPSVFTPYAMLSLAGQAAAHVSLLAWAHSRADALMGADPDARAPDTDFAPNLVNTTAYLVNVQLMLATFGANYVGAPFCTPLSAAKPLARTLLYGSLAVAALMLGVVPGAERALSLVRIPYPLAPSLVAACAADFAACVVWERALRAALPARRPRLLAGGVGGGGGEGRAKRD